MSSTTTLHPRFLAIAEAVCYWLGYQFKIGRNLFIHEASLRYPIADTITAFDFAINQVALEQLHPIFKSKQIDLVLLKDGKYTPINDVDDRNIAEVYEFKLAKCETQKQGSVEHQRVFDDVIRLAYYNLFCGKDCYFLMCGKFDEFKTYFVGQKTVVSNSGGKTVVPQTSQIASASSDNWDPKGLYADWFRFEINKLIEKEFDEASASWGLKPFKSKYQIREGLSHSFGTKIKIRTTCMAISPCNSSSRTHAAGIWKIEGISPS